MADPRDLAAEAFILRLQKVLLLEELVVHLLSSIELDLEAFGFGGYLWRYMLLELAAGGDSLSWAGVF